MEVSPRLLRLKPDQTVFLRSFYFPHPPPSILTQKEKTLAFASGRYTCPSQNLGIIMQSGDSLNWIRLYRQIIKRKPSVNSGVICKNKGTSSVSPQPLRNSDLFLFGRLSPTSTCAIEAERQILVRLWSANSFNSNRILRRRRQGSVAKSPHPQCASEPWRGDRKCAGT